MVSQCQSEKGKYHTLDVLRGFAAIWVFIMHLSLSYPISHLSQPLQSIFARGGLGVAMFFVISGYCLMASARSFMRRGESSLKFLYRRALRIYPPFWCSVAAIVALPYLIEVLSSLKSGVYTPPRPTLPASFSEWISVLTLTQVFHSQGEALHLSFGNINSVYWTLAIEVQFYLVVALALASGKKWVWPFLFVTALSCWFALTPATYTWGIFLPYWPMFALGLGLHQLLEHDYSPTYVFGRYAFVVSGSLLLLAVFACCAAFAWTRFAIDGPDTPSPDLFLFAVIFTGLLWLGQAVDRRISQVRECRRWFLMLPIRILFVLGAMSYSIYLLHTKLCFLTMQFVRQVAAPGSILFFVGCVAGTILICYPFYRWCEKPFMSPRSSFPGSGSRLPGRNDPQAVEKFSSLAPSCPGPVPVPE